MNNCTGNELIMHIEYTKWAHQIEQKMQTVRHQNPAMKEYMMDEAINTVNLMPDFKLFKVETQLPNESTEMDDI